MLYWGISISVCSCSGLRPLGVARFNSSSRSYQARGGRPAPFSAASTDCITEVVARTNLAQAVT